MFMRMVQVKLKPEAAKEVPGLYASTIVPTLQRTPGCLHASLIRSVARPDESISLTLWDSLEHADAYEQSGVFQSLLQQVAPYLADSSEWKIQHTFSELYQWKMAMERIPGAQVTTSEDLTIGGYNLVSGKTFQ